MGGNSGRLDDNPMTSNAAINATRQLWLVLAIRHPIRSQLPYLVRRYGSVSLADRRVLKHRPIFWPQRTDRSTGPECRICTPRCWILLMMALAKTRSHAVRRDYPAPLSALKGLPFGTYFAPGLILFCALGLGPLAAAQLAWRRHPQAPLLSWASATRRLAPDGVRGSWPGHERAVGL